MESSGRLRSVLHFALMAISPRVQELFDWLVDGAPGASTPMAVLDRMNPSLLEAGIPVDRVVALVRTLHPHVVGRRFTWEPGEKTKVAEATWAMVTSPMFVNSPFNKVTQTRQELRVRLEGTDAGGFDDLKELEAKGFTDYVAMPMLFMSGTTHVISAATRRPGGFTDEHLEALRYVSRPLARVGEILAMIRTAANVLGAYVGRDAGERILKGQIQRGDTESIHAVIWFSDLRGFTVLSGERTPTQIIGVLNEFFDCQVPAIEKHGGEVLKFIGDGLLAIFPIDGKRDAAEQGKQALLAAQEAFTALDALNGTRAARGDGKLAFGVALHEGEVAYGNIGGANRLDFTAIGPAVNVASRIEGLTGKLGKQVLVSEQLAKQMTVTLSSVGEFELKGVSAKHAVYEPTR